MEMKQLLRLILIFLTAFPVYTEAGIFNFKEDLRAQVDFYSSQISTYNAIVAANNDLLIQLKNELKIINEEIFKIADIIKNIDPKKTDDKDKLILKQSELTLQRDKIERLKNSFSNKIVWLYKNGTDFPLMVLFTSVSINQLYSRLEYLNKIAKIRNREFKKIKIETDILSEKQKLSGMNMKEKQKYISEKKESQKSLLMSKFLFETKIDSLSAINEMLTRNIERMSQRSVELENDIRVLPEIKFDISQQIEYGTKPFSELKGQLISPVLSNSIYIDFGKTVHPVYKNITYNNGIDFSIRNGSPVLAVEDGVVEEIFFVPGYGNVVLIAHNEIFKTVYGIISEVSVTKGQEVKAGKQIAKTSVNLDGQLFHFEIHENNIPVDPKKWIKW